MQFEERRLTARQHKPEARSLVAVYNDIFEVLRADPAELKDECFRIRYQVYCLENQFEPADAWPDGRERDRYDQHSLHGLLRYRKTGASLGTIRLVLPVIGTAEAPLPMYAVCASHDLALSLPPAARTVEVSRFAISKQFRQRSGDALYGRAYTPAEMARDERRIIPHMTLGLMGLALRLSQDSGAEYVCAIMEPSLIRLLSRIGIHWTEVGPRVEYHGVRQPCFSRIDDILRKVEAEFPSIWEVITDTAGYHSDRRRPGIDGATRSTDSIHDELMTEA